MTNFGGMIGVERAIEDKVRACIFLMLPSKSSTIEAPRSSDIIKRIEDDQRVDGKIELKMRREKTFLDVKNVQEGCYL